MMILRRQPPWPPGRKIILIRIYIISYIVYISYMILHYRRFDLIWFMQISYDNNDQTTKLTQLTTKYNHCHKKMRICFTTFLRDQIVCGAEDIISTIWCCKLTCFQALARLLHYLCLEGNLAQYCPKGWYLFIPTPWECIDKYYP